MGVPSESRVRCMCYVVSVWCGRSQTVRAGRGGGGGAVRESSGAVCVLCSLSVVWAVTDGESGGGGGVPSESRRVRCVCCVVSVWCGRSQTVRAGGGGRQRVVGCGVCAMWSQCGVGGHRR